MARVTYYVALPFVRNEEGEFVPGAAEACHNAGDAKAKARHLANRHGASIAFTRTGDPDLGDFQPAVILGQFGDVPEGVDLAEAA